MGRRLLAQRSPCMPGARLSAQPSSSRHMPCSGRITMAASLPSSLGRAQDSRQPVVQLGQREMAGHRRLRRRCEHRCRHHAQEKHGCPAPGPNVVERSNAARARARISPSAPVLPGTLLRTAIGGETSGCAMISSSRASAAGRIRFHEDCRRRGYMLAPRQGRFCWRGNRRWCRPTWKPCERSG